MRVDSGFSSRSRRGFSLLVVVLITGVLAVTALLVFNTLADDVRLQGLERRIRDARDIAEGGLMEIINDGGIFGLLPSTPGETARFEHRDSSASVFGSSSEERDYRGEVTLVRTAPVLESSQRRVRALLYEVHVQGRMPGKETSDLEAVIYRLGVAPADSLRREVHGR